MSGNMTPNNFTFEENSILLLNALTKLRLSGRYYTPPTSPQAKRARVEGVSFNTFDLSAFLNEQIPITQQDMNASDEELASVLFDKGLMNPIVPKLKIEDFYAMVADKQDLKMDVECSKFLKELFVEKPVDWMDDGMDEILCTKPAVDNSWADDDMDAAVCRAAQDVEEGLITGLVTTTNAQRAQRLKAAEAKKAFWKARERGWDAMKARELIANQTVYEEELMKRVDALEADYEHNSTDLLALYEKELAVLSWRDQHPFNFGKSVWLIEVEHRNFMCKNGRPITHLPNTLDMETVYLQMLQRHMEEVEKTLQFDDHSVMVAELELKSWMERHPYNIGET